MTVGGEETPMPEGRVVPTMALVPGCVSEEPEGMSLETHAERRAATDGRDEPG